MHWARSIGRLPKPYKLSTICRSYRLNLAGSGGNMVFILESRLYYSAFALYFSDSLTGTCSIYAVLKNNIPVQSGYVRRNQTITDM